MVEISHLSIAYTVYCMFELIKDDIESYTHILFKYRQLKQ